MFCVCVSRGYVFFCKIVGPKIAIARRIDNMEHITRAAGVSQHTNLSCNRWVIEP